MNEMEAKNLRIGNYYQENGKIYKVDINDLINLIRHEGTKYKSDMDKITLTDNWLINFGFVTKTKLSGHDGFYLNGWYVMPEKDCYSFMIAGSSVVLTRLNFVHELQNLFFALTNTELYLKN
jgi:hypothetical protein